MNNENREKINITADMENDCDKPEILTKYNGCCPEEQKCKCHEQK